MRRMVLPGTAAAAAVGISLLVATGGQAARPQAAVSSPGAAALLHRALADGNARGSFHLAEKDVYGGVHATESNDAGRDLGRQQITTATGAHAQVLVIKRVAYISGNLKGWVDTLGFPGVIGSFVGDGAVSVTPASSSYSTIAGGVTTASALSELKLVGPLTEGTPTTYRGQTVIPISGQAPKSDPGVGAQTVYVSRSSTPLPVYSTMKLTGKGTSGSATMVFSRWGQPVKLTTPKSPLSVNALPAVIVAASGEALLHYGSFTGPHGYSPPVGRPWYDSQCKPVVLQTDPDVPAWMVKQAETAVAQARAQGIDVALETSNGNWDPSSLYYRDGQSPKTVAQVELDVSHATPPKDTHVHFAWNTRLSKDRKHEQLTSFDPSFYVKSIGQSRQEVREVTRLIIAMSEGVSRTSLRGSPLYTDELKDKVDRFTLTDIAAMLQMSGCVPHSNDALSLPTQTVTVPRTSTTGTPFKWR